MKITGILIILFGFVVSYYGGYHTNPSRTIASNSDESLVNPLIDNRKAMQARRHVWLNEDANRIFMSTFEFEEDLTGMSQVQWAVDQAQKGKTVDLVLDAAGHRLSDETILYMVENGVNVHIFSPSFSWRGYKARLARMYRDRPTRSFSLPSIEAAWRQLTYRMHDKILWNENPNHPAGGEVILGGRNARDSHYGIDMRVMSQTRKESGQKIDVINPAFEYEHEILVHNQDLHGEVQTYIDGFLESSHTERVKAGELRERLANSRKYQEKHGDSWKTKLAADKTQFDDGFKQFTSDMQAWNKSYLFAIQNVDTQEINSKRLTKNLVRIFQEHANTLARLTEEGSFRPKVLLDLLQPLTGSTITGIVKDAISSEEGSKVVFEALTELMDQSTPTIEHNIRLGNLTEAKLNKFLGPLGAPKTGIAGKVSGIAQAIKNSSYSIGLDVNKYENLPKITGAALESMNEFIPTNEINWLKAAQEVDLSEFMHDTVTENAFRKKSMDELFELISNCREECVWNSQYGSLTPEAISAINNVIKKNSAMYRFINNQFRKPNNVVSAQEKAETIIKLFASNRSYLASRLSNEFIPADLLKQDLKELKHELSKIFDGVEDGRVKLNSIFGQLSTGIKNKDTDAFEKFSNRLTALIRSEKEHIANLIKDDADIVERVMLSMQGYIDEDPKGILPPHKKINFYFMTNDVDSWAVGADKAIHADFHKNILHEFRKMGPGLHVYGLNSGGRIHSKVAITESGMIISSMNADPRSEKFNTEVGVKVITKNKGSHITDQYKQHILSYMLNQRAHIKDGQLVREKQCFDALTTIARRVLYPIL